LIDRLIFQPLALNHIEELGALLLNEAVYEHIGGSPPGMEDFRLGMRRVLAGPPPHRAGEEWINHAVRLRGNGVLLGRLEATVHDGIAEVAFLFGPEHWGMGYATEGLLWLTKLLLSRPDSPRLWATTLPANQRCQALLRRCGYVLASTDHPERLLSYDDGDLVFRGPRHDPPHR